MDNDRAPDHVERPGEDDQSERQLHDVLHRSQGLGFLGPGSVEEHSLHAQVFLRIIEDRMLHDLPSRDHLRILDLGSGGGVPGLVLARALPRAQVVLLDAMQRRCRFLEEAVTTLQLAVSVDIWCGRAELLARDQAARGGFDVVVARSFGPPAVTAECAVGFLRPMSALLLVSEPPVQDETRWPESGLSMLGLELGERRSTEVATVQVIRSTAAPDERYPRRTGVPAKRPLF